MNPPRIADLLAMGQSQLDDVFRNSNAGAIPVGDTQGTAVLLPDKEVITSAFARIARWLAWRGKVFDPKAATLKNKISVLNIPAIKARVYREASWFDGNEAIILDYSKTSFLAQKIRDEIREVSPGVYLGLVYWGKVRILNFILKTPDAA